MPRFAWCLGALLAGLLTVGVETRTPVRHLFQMLPALVALVLSLRRAPWAADASLPVFTVWFVIMAAIWLTVSGVAHLVPGHFPPVEVALTVVIGGASAIGLPLAARSSDAPFPVRIGAALAFAVFQLVAVYLSLATRVSRI